jgi:Polyketide cyclase / dehydrase and lipid transport
MQVEHRILIQAPAERIFGIYEKVNAWHTWDPDTKQAHIDGPFEAGSRGKLTPAKGNTVPLVLTQVVKNKLFTAESKIPLFRMVFEHELKPDGKNTEVVHRVTFSGPLCFLLGRVLGKQVDAGLPVTLANLKKLAESRDRR